MRADLASDVVDVGESRLDVGSLLVSLQLKS